MRKTTFNGTDGGIRDVWDGELIKSLRQKSISRVDADGKGVEAEKSYYFESLDPDSDGSVVELCLELYMDGINPYHTKHEEQLAFVIVIHNLPKEERFHKGNIHVPMIVPRRSGVDFDFNSFIRPLVDDCTGMSKGFYVYDAKADKEVLVKAHLTFIGGDIPAVAKLMGFKGQTSDHPCRACTIDKMGYRPRGNSKTRMQKGLPSNKSGPVRSNEQYYGTHEFYTYEVAKVNDLATTAAQKQKYLAECNYRLVGQSTTKSAIFELGSLTIPWSFPPDTMPLFYENIMHTALRTLLGEGMTSPREYELKKLNKVVEYVNSVFM